MKSKEEFKAKLKDGEFIKLFAGVKSAEEVSKVAKNLGYDVKPTDVKSTNLTDDMLEAVAGGGKGSVEQSIEGSATNDSKVVINGGQFQPGSSGHSDPVVTPTVSPNIDLTGKGGK